MTGPQLQSWFTSVSQSPSTISIAPEAAFLLHNSLAPSTWRRYGKILRTYESFCRQYHYASYPSSFKTVSHWLAQILSSVKPATAKSYLGMLKSFHVETGMSVTALKLAVWLAFMAEVVRSLVVCVQ